MISFNDLVYYKEGYDNFRKNHTSKDILTLQMENHLYNVFMYAAREYYGDSSLTQNEIIELFNNDYNNNNNMDNKKTK